MIRSQRLQRIEEIQRIFESGTLKDFSTEELIKFLMAKKGYSRRLTMDYIKIARFNIENEQI